MAGFLALFKLHTFTTRSRENRNSHIKSTKFSFRNDLWDCNFLYMMPEEGHLNEWMQCMLKQKSRSYWEVLSATELSNLE